MAVIDRVSDFIKVAISLKDSAAVPNPPGPGLSCLRGFFFFDQGDPESFYVCSRTWWMANLRELRYGMDKEYSWAASRIAIPQLENEINVRKDPRQAEEQFRIIASDPGPSGTPMGEVEKDNKEPSA